MTVEKGIYLYNSAVNSNTAVWAIGAAITYGWANLTNADPVPGKYNIVEVREGGWENPIFTIRGNIDPDAAGSNEITEVLMKQFARAYTTQTYVSIGLGTDATPTPISTSTASVTESAKGGKTGVWIPVVFKTFTINPAGESGHMIAYQMVLVEETA